MGLVLLPLQQVSMFWVVTKHLSAFHVLLVEDGVEKNAVALFFCVLLKKHEIRVVFQRPSHFSVFVCIDLASCCEHHVQNLLRGWAWNSVKRCLFFLSDLQQTAATLRSLDYVQRGMHYKTILTQVLPSAGTYAMLFAQDEVFVLQYQEL